MIRHSERHLYVRKSDFSTKSQDYYEVVDTRYGNTIFTSMDEGEAKAVRALMVGDAKTVCDRLSQFDGTPYGPLPKKPASSSNPDPDVGADLERYAYAITHGGEVYYEGRRIGAVPTPLEALTAVAMRHALDNLVVPVQSQRYRNRTLRKVCPSNAARDPDKARWEVIHRGRRVGKLVETIEQARALADKHVDTLKNHGEWVDE